MKKIMDNKGITLIALVITIIILLILAGITINSLMGSDGIIAKAKWSAYVTEYEAVNEAKEMYATSNLIDKYGKNTYKVASLEGTGSVSGDGEIIYPVGN